MMDTKAIVFRAGTRLTHAVPSTSAIPVQTIVCTEEAARAIEEWPAHG